MMDMLLLDNIGLMIDNGDAHLSQEEVDGRLFGREFLELDELGQRVVVPLGREEDRRPLELAQRALRRQPEIGDGSVD